MNANLKTNVTLSSYREKQENCETKMTKIRACVSAECEISRFDETVADIADKILAAQE